MKSAKGLCVLLLCSMLWQCASSTKRIRPPRVQSDLKLDYPITAQIDHIEGEVDIAVFVSNSGQAEEIKLLKSSSHQVLDDAAIAFARKVVFTPAYVDERPVSAWTRLLLRYRLTEVPFDRGRWLSDAHSYLKQASQESDSVKREAILRRLYTHHAGLHTFSSNRNDLSVNDIAEAIVDPAIKERWRPLWSHYPVPFVVLDDFLLRFPDSALAPRVKEDLTKMLLDTQFRIRMDSMKSQSKARRTLPLIDLIDTRLQELGFVATQPAGQTAK